MVLRQRPAQPSLATGRSFSHEPGAGRKCLSDRRKWKWSHADSNGGPPACEKGQENVRRRPQSSDVVDSRRVSKKR